ncbi:MAG: DNA adenine methylase [Gammaproteobacteria bacterium]|nr:DNA adenine methylase [Gammaproteobacteria bacterium]
MQVASLCEEQQTLPRSNRSNSPFRYPGGKFYARRLILNVIPEHNNYCEPFAGGASIFFAKNGSAASILNDLDFDVINTFRQIRDNVEGLINLLDGIKATKKLHAYYKNTYRPTNELEAAFRWFYLNRTSYSGIMKPENCYWGYGPKYSMRPENWPPHLRTVSDRLQGVNLLSEDFEWVIDKLPNGCFAFIDPPYYAADQHKFYNCPFDQADHERLASCLFRNSRRIKFLLTYDNHSDILSLYDWAKNISNKQWNYTINRTDDQKNGTKLKDGFRGSRDKGQELFISNYHV